MKPNPLIGQTRNRRVHAEISAATQRHVQPRVEFSYRGSLEDFGSHADDCAPSFHRLSENYLRLEAPRAFATEAIVFGAILLTAAVPLINSASAVFHLMRVGM